MEPAPLVPLNNAEAQLGAVEQEEEERILGELSAMVVKKEKKIRCILASVTALDIASARAKHAAWLGAVEPTLQNHLDTSQIQGFCDDSTSTTPTTETLPLNAVGPVHIAGVVHPLLMQPFLPPLPKPPLPEINLSIGPSDPNSGSLAGVNLVPELWNEKIEAQSGGNGSGSGGNGSGGRTAQRKPRRGSANNSAETSNSDATSTNEESSNSSTSNTAGAAGAGNFLVPIDLIVPFGKKVVAVTGPNTGGKTASLKALGLVSLMAKAGMFVPISPEARHRLEDISEENNNKNIVSIAWFDKILADLGDGQSLQQSLSTFSGHVRRLRGILTETTPYSLVLLDEVGSGTDPGEGAALAAALLLQLSQGQAALTYATTHHAELKEVATSNPLFVNASVEFDIHLLKPTYKLLWGQSGDSNALAVASGLGFDPRVVNEARDVALQLSSGATSAASRAVALRESLEAQAISVKNAAAEATKRRKAAEMELKEAEELLKLQQQEHSAAFSTSTSSKKKNKTSVSTLAKQSDDINVEEEDVFLKIRKIISNARNGKITPESAEKELKRIEKSIASSNEAAMTLAGLKWGDGDSDGSSSSDEDGDYQISQENGVMTTKSFAMAAEWAPKTGDYVKVLKMGGAIGQILNVGGGKISVKIGSLTMQLRQTDVLPSAAPPPAMKSSPGGRFSTASRMKAGGAFKPDNFSSSSNNNKSSLGVAIQTSRNTVDCRGMNTDQAVAAVEVALNDSRPGSVVFAVHGVGTGRVRSAVLEALKRHPSVVKMEEAEASNGGCTVAYLR
jgi:DNA mismatch repair protein MutS2